MLSDKVALRDALPSLQSSHTKFGVVVFYTMLPDMCWLGGHHHCCLQRWVALRQASAGLESRDVEFG